MAGKISISIEDVFALSKNQLDDLYAYMFLCARQYEPDEELEEMLDTASVRMNPGVTEEEILDIVSGTPSADSTGLPWDVRIHASTKTLTQDGKWKKRKGIEAEEVTRVEAELRGTVTAPVPEPEPAFNPFAATPEPEPTAPMSYNELIPFVTKAVQKQQVTNDQITNAVTKIGLPSFPMLQNRPDLIPALLTELNLS